MKHKFQNLMNEAEEAKKARRLLDERLDRILQSTYLGAILLDHVLDSVATPRIDSYLVRPYTSVAICK